MPAGTSKAKGYFGKKRMAQDGTGPHGRGAGPGGGRKDGSGLKKKSRSK